MNAIKFSMSAFLLAICGTGCSTENPSTGGSGGTAPAAGGSSGNAGTSTGGLSAGGVSGSSTGGATSTLGGSTSAAGASNGGATSTGGATTAKGGTTGTAGAAGSASGGTTPTAGTTAAGGSSAGSGGSGGLPGAVDLPQVVTSAEGAFWKTGTYTEVTSGNADVTVNDGSPAQTWDYFGGSFNERGWQHLMSLSQEDRDLAMKLLFGQDGARFNSGRIPIGASDYAIDPYSLNETKGDNAMANFSIAQDKKFLIPYIKAALAVNPNILLWASPWTPPSWMKSNNNLSGGNMKEDDTNLEAYALYLTKFVQEYAKEGIKISAIHPQNEPGFAQGYPSCLWSAGGMATFIGKWLGPKFEKDVPDTKIFLGTMSASGDSAIVSKVTGDATAMKYVDGFGLQWNMMSAVGGLKSRNMSIWQTEHKCGNYPFTVSGAPAFRSDKAPNDFAYAIESWGYIRDWIKAGSTAYAAWNMVLDPVGVGNDKTRNWPQNALIIADPGSKKLTPTPTYYVFRHASQFVETGAKVVGASGGDTLAFKNPNGSIVAVMYNSGAAKKAIVSMGGKKLQFDMPNRGWSTVYLKP